MNDAQLDKVFQFGIGFGGVLLLWLAAITIYLWTLMPPPWPLPLFIGPLIGILAGGGGVLIWISRCIR
jgi:hypothetical protein